MSLGHRHPNWPNCSNRLNESSRNINARWPRANCKQGGKRWTKSKQALSRRHPHPLLTHSKMSDAIKRYSYLLGQTDLFKHFVDLKVN
jgi:SWI/SNF-related matrix-associated actin-dependent regulator of chromatin subfamily A member 5